MTGGGSATSAGDCCVRARSVGDVAGDSADAGCDEALTPTADGDAAPMPRLLLPRRRGLLSDDTGRRAPGMAVARAATAPGDAPAVAAAPPPAVDDVRDDDAAPAPYGGGGGGGGGGSGCVRCVAVTAPPTAVYASGALSARWRHEYCAAPAPPPAP